MIRPAADRLMEAPERTEVELGWLLVSAALPPWEEPPPRPDVDGVGPPGALPEATWAWWEAVLAYLAAMVVAAVPLLLMQALFGGELLAGNSGPSFVAVLVIGELAFFVT